MIRTEIELTEEQSKALERLAHKDNVPIAEVIRRSIDDYIATHIELSMEEKKRRALSVVGMFDSGLPDLGVNHDKYLEEAYLPNKALPC